VSKNILLFADGTGNEGGLLPDESRTNVYKLYRATRNDSILAPRLLSTCTASTRQRLANRRGGFARSLSRCSASAWVAGLRTVMPPSSASGSPVTVFISSDSAAVLIPYAA